MNAVPGVSRFRKFALFCLGYNILVILWGAFVRATGSGAGCGSHWPLCNGEILPRAERIQTVIEFAHRASSGLCLIFALILMFWSWRLYPKKHLVRRASNWTLGLTIVEALIGAGIVLLSLVEHDQSYDRAISISLHLVNTLFLVAALTLTFRWSQSDETPQLSWNPSYVKWIFASIGGTLLLGVTGALTALGDTLFRATSLKAGMAQDFAEGSHFLLKLRILHPALAVIMAIVLFVFSETMQRQTDSDQVRGWARFLQGSLILQMFVGVINLVLLAPVSLQILHLLMADLTWISLIMLCAATLESSARVPAPIVAVTNQA